MTGVGMTGKANVDEDKQPGDPRGVGFGRASALDSFAARREAAQRRLSSTLRQTEMIDHAVRMLLEQLTEFELSDDSGSLRATARALLSVASGAESYDVTFVDASVHAAIRVRHTTFGLEAEVVRPSSSA